MPAEPDLPGKNGAPPEQHRRDETDADPNDEVGNGRGVAVAGKLAPAMLVRATRWARGGARRRRSSASVFRRKRRKA
jgi:hypothetical protein